MATQTQKDWTGNGNSIYKTLGASNHTKEEREVLDYYATHPSAIDKLKTKFEIPSKVWEVSCGEGHLSKRLIELGHEVFSSDIVDRGYGDEKLDFLSLEAYKYQGKFPCILTNPPYIFLTQFILRAMELLPDKGYACFFVKTTALEGKGRYDRIFRFTPPHSYFPVHRTSAVCKERGVRQGHEQCSVVLLDDIPERVQG